MFKYLLAIAVCLICLVLLQQGCQGFGERFRKRMDERKEQRQERWQDWKEHRFDRREGESSDGERKHIFRHFWQRRREHSDDSEGNRDDEQEPILIEE